MTIPEAAERLGLSQHTVRNQVHNGALRATKRGRDWWITESAVARYAAEHLGRHVGGRPKATA